MEPSSPPTSEKCSQRFRFKPGILETPPGSKPKTPPRSLSFTECKPTKQFAFSKHSNKQEEESRGHALPGSELSWQDWLRRHFAHICTAPFGARHERLWEWIEALTPGERPRARVEVWPRGGGKSTQAELACARVGVKLTRRFVLYISETQDQANLHVQAAGSLFEHIGVERSVNRYGSSKGWRRDQLRTANGFNVAAYGLDAAARGVKLDHYRPDLLVFDDLDSHDDTERTIEKKINAITTMVIPAGSPDCAMIFIQNLIHEESIFSRLADGRADFLHNREPACVEPAVRGLATETVDRGDGLKVYRITAGEPTWAGQSIAICEEQINDWGLRAFLREAQHEVAGASGYVFDVSQIQYINADEVPQNLPRCRAWDLAATQDGGDWTVGPLLAVQGTFPHVKVYVIDVERGRWSSEKVDQKIEDCARMDGPQVTLRLPQDPAAAGKRQAEQHGTMFANYRPIILPVTGDKVTRAKGFAAAVNKGNVYFVRADWNFPVREVLRKFREDVPEQMDDDVDALADAFNQLVSGRRLMQVS